MKTSSVLNTPEMAAVKNQLAPQEAGLLDGALAELRRQRELERVMSERAAEAQRQQALIQAARDAEREMIQQLAQEAAIQRRAEHELSVATADQDDLSNEAHRAIGALPKQSHRGSRMSNRSNQHRNDIAQLVDAIFEKDSQDSMTYRPPRTMRNPFPSAVPRLGPTGNPIRRPPSIRQVQEAQEVRAPRYDVGPTRVNEQGDLVRGKSSQVRDAALVGYELPGQGAREVYLESRAPTAADRTARALMGGGAGSALGALGGAAAALAGRGRGVPNVLKGGLGLGALGATLGALNPMSVRTAYDPDYGTQLSEAEERRAAAVQRALMPGLAPSNIAMQQPGTEFGGALRGQEPTFSYAADIDDMVREDPAMAQALVGKYSAAQKKTDLYNNAPQLKGGQKTQLPDRLQKEIIDLQKRKQAGTKTPPAAEDAPSKKSGGYSSATRTRRGVKSVYDKVRKDAQKSGAGRKNSPHGHRVER